MKIAEFRKKANMKIAEMLILRNLEDNRRKNDETVRPKNLQEQYTMPDALKNTFVHCTIIFMYPHQHLPLARLQRKRPVVS